MIDAIKDQVKTLITMITHCPKERINDHEEIINYDIDSMKAAELIFLIEENYKIKILEEDYDKLMTVNQIAEYIHSALIKKEELQTT